MSGPVQSFRFRHVRRPDLRANGAGWMLRGRFRIQIQFEPSEDVSRYEYRQYIRGRAWTQAGEFPDDATPSMQNWSPTADRVNAARAFAIPGGLSTSWAEDGQGSARFGYRNRPAVARSGLVDRYTPDQENGDRYELVDTYGLEGDQRIPSTNIFFHLVYRFVVVDTRGGGSPEIYSQVFRTTAERILPPPPPTTEE